MLIQKQPQTWKSPGSLSRHFLMLSGCNVTSFSFAYDVFDRLDAAKTEPKLSGFH